MTKFVIAGNGIIALSAAFDLTKKISTGDTISIVGPASQLGSATLAAGAMLKGGGAACGCVMGGTLLSAGWTEPVAPRSAEVAGSETDTGIGQIRIVPSSEAVMSEVRSLLSQKDRMLTALVCPRSTCSNRP